MNDKWSLGQSLKRCLPVAAVQFSSLCGPTMASGAYATNYFSKWGPQGLWMIGFWMALMAVGIFFGMYMANAFGVHNYRDFYRALYGARIYKYASPFVETYSVAGGVLAESVQLKLAGDLFSSLFGWHPLFGSTLMALLVITLMLWGAELVRKTASVTTLILLIGFSVLLYYAVSIKGVVISSFLHDYHIYETWGSGRLSEGFLIVFLYGLSTMSCPHTLCNVSQKMKPGVGDALTTAILAPVMLSLPFTMTYLIALGFAPESLAQGAPNLWIAATQINRDWIVGLYYFIMLFALASCGPMLTFSYANRWQEVFFGKSRLSTPVKLGVTAVAFKTVCLLFSTVSLTTILTKGFTTIGAVAGPLIIAPMVFLTFGRSKRRMASVIAKSGE